MTLRQLVYLFNDELVSLYSPDESKAIVDLVALHVLGGTQSSLMQRRDEVLPAVQTRKFVEIMDELKKERPIQYILGETEFYRLNFKVTPAVLIPRPETEELVDWILNSEHKNKEINILDIGTGSGCIPVSLKKTRPDWRLTGLDVMADALSLAHENALANQVSIDFLKEDILDKPKMDLRFDAIVSNPPYITQTEKADMHQNVLKNEPHIALFVSDENPLLFYNAISDFALEHLTTNGRLYFEINSYLGQKTTALLREKGFESIELRKDINGRDRMIRCVRP